MTSSEALHYQQHLVADPKLDPGGAAAGLQCGMMLGRYLLVEDLGCQCAWLAIAPDSARVFIKVRCNQLRLEHERRVLRVLDHPSLVKLFDPGEDPTDRRPGYLVRQYLDGPAAYDYLQTVNQSRQHELFELVRGALDHAHARGAVGICTNPLFARMAGDTPVFYGTGNAGWLDPSIEQFRDLVQRSYAAVEHAQLRQSWLGESYEQAMREATKHIEQLQPQEPT